jgi:LysM repeat protein
MNQIVMNLLRNGGPFLGQMRAQSRVTVQPDFWLNQSSGVVGNYPVAKLPVRWWQREDNSQVEVEIPNVKMVQIVRDLTQQAATVEIDIYNTVIPPGGTAQDIPTSLGDPGFFSWARGSTIEAQQRWNQTPNAWSNILRENACIRVYQGYGGYNPDGSKMSIPDAVAGGWLILKGVFLLDDPAIESNGITKLNGRDMAKLLIDQQTVPPLIPAAKYPINYWGPGQTGTATIAAVPGYGITTYVSEWLTQRCTYDDDSGHNRTVGLRALDNNNNTAWVSNNGGGPAGQVWYQIDVQGLVSGYYINPFFGNYTCFVSAFSGGRWVSGQLSAPLEYVVQPGDTLWDIAEDFMGNPLDWPIIYNNNRGVIGPNPNLIYPGQVLVIGGQAISLPGPTQTGVIHYTVVSGDTLWAIAGRFLGNPLDWPTIYNQNRAVIGGNPNLIFPGQVLTIGIGAVGAYALPLETARWYTLPHALNVQKIRFTFTNLHPWSGMWVSGIRELKVGNVGKVPVVGKSVQDIAPTPSGKGYWIIGTDGAVFAYGDAGNYGNLAGRSLPGAIIGGSGTATGKGYWLLGADGSVYTFGDAHNYGRATTSALTGALVAFRRSTDGAGYWMPSADATVAHVGDATYYGTTVAAGARIVDMAPNPASTGYWLLDANGTVYPCGSVFNYGNGSSAQKWVGIDCTSTGNGYWLVANNGTVSAFGDAVNHGGANNVALVAPITGIKRQPTSNGYWLVAGNGAVYSYGAPFYGSLPLAYTYNLPADYSDYADIITDLALWAGFWLYPTGGTINAASPPAVFGNIETTGAYDTLGPLGIQFFDKRPVIDVMTDIANLVGYLVRVDEAGALRFEAPNIWAVGNFYDDQTATSFIPTVDERINLSDYVQTQSDQDLRSPIIVAVADPYEYGGPIKGTNVTTFIPPYANLMKGQIKSAMYAVPLQVAAQDQQYFAELIALRIWFQTRTGAVTAWCDPTIEVDDQVRIYERNSGETNVHYVQAITSTHDLDSGKYEMQLTTYWLGGHDAGWAVTSNLNSFFGNTNEYPVTASGTLALPNQPFPISDQLALFLGASGAKTTQVYNTGASLL